MKYIKQNMWKLLQDKLKSESILKKLRRSKDRKKSAIKRKLEKDLWHFVENMHSVRQESQLYIVEDNKDADESVDSVRQEYIAEDNKDAYGSMDSVRQREPIICTYTWSKD